MTDTAVKSRLCGWCGEPAGYVVAETPLCASCWEYVQLHWEAE